MVQFRIGKARIKSFAYFCLAIISYVLALQLFFIENRIAAGGFAGIATVLNYIIPISVGNIIFILNIPLTLIAFKVMGWKYAVKTLFAMAAYSAVANLLEFIPLATHDKIAACIFGGLLYAVGSVLLIHARASVGGTDLVARLLLHKFKNLSLGGMFMIVDGFTVILAMVIFKDLESGVYAFLAIASCSLITDRIITGFNYADICFIVTSQDPEAMGLEIMKELQGGITRFTGLGMFEKTPRHVLMIAVRPRETWLLKEIIHRHDPHAFFVVAWASEVKGGRFGLISANKNV